MVDASALRMCRGALLVNIARGELVRTGALSRALDAGSIAGAGLDVTDPEPLPLNHPLRGDSRVVITPHVAGASRVRRAHLLDLVGHNLANFAAGRRLRNRVDYGRGF